MIAYIVTGILMTLTAGLLMSVCITGIIFEDDWGWRRKLVSLVLAFAIGFGIAAVFALEDQAEAETWNNGYCANCNVEWRFTNAQHIKNHGERYYYVCDNCGAVMHRGG